MLRRILNTLHWSRWGLLGSGVIVLSALISAVVYRGAAGEAYSPFNHFISELGQGGVSQLAVVFNAGLIGGGLLLIPFMLGLGAYLDNPVAWLSGAAGVVAALCCSAVGVFPMNDLIPHMTAAMGFFRSGMVTIALFSLAIALDRRRKLSKWWVLPGVLVTACFATFLLLPRTGRSTEQFQNFQGLIRTRPGWWWMAISEWSVFVAVLGWVVGMCIYRLVAQRHAHRLPQP